MAAVRVPPSACSTSQSSQMVHSLSAPRSTTERRQRPIRREISRPRLSGLPARASRILRLPVEPGSMPYSAVSQPLPLPFSQRGTPSSMQAVQSTRVFP